VEFGSSNYELTLDVQMFAFLSRAPRFCLALLLVGLNVADASTVSYSGLSRDTASTTFYDSLNNREWLSWDLSSGYSYQQILAALGTGGAFQGFNLANNADAQAFVSAIFPNGGACSVTGVALCGVASSDLETVIGADDVVPDYALFSSANGIGQDFGLLISFPNANPAFSTVYKSNEALSAAALPSFLAASAPKAGWLLYRTPTVYSVPEPSTFALFGLALAAFTVVRRRKM
jgi:hypothetical protein